MSIFDFNVHLPRESRGGTQERLGDERGCDVPALRSAYRSHRETLRGGMSGANLMIFNEALPFGDAGMADWVSEVRQDFPDAAFTQLLDFRRDGLAPAIDRLVGDGVEGVKFHSYVQRITDADIPSALAAARAAAERGLFVCIDASYGTTYLYDHDNLKLAATVVREIDSVPIVILHSGGARRWEAMLLAEENPHVYLETSFTLPYYEGSTVVDDLAFIYRKIGVDRVLYASDFPYVGLKDALDCMQRFLETRGFSEDERAGILGGNARRLLGGLASRANGQIQGRTTDD